LNFKDVFHQWLEQAEHKPNPHLSTGASTLCWTIWLTRNDDVFDKCQLKILFRFFSEERIGFARWALLQRSDDIKKMMIQTCQSLEISALRFFLSMDGRLV
jgi:hypothetical protein